MKRPFIVIFLLILGFSCNSQIKQDSGNKNLEMIDSILTETELPLVNNFDLTSNIELSASHWKPLNPTRKVDTFFYKKVLQNDKILGHWNDYQELYYFGKVEYKTKIYLVISQWVGNGDECNIFLIDFNDKGKINKIITVARQYKFPDEYNYLKSIIVEGKLVRTSVNSFEDQERETKDSIVESFDLKDFTRLNYDSIRIK
jgi:hypothetical protein